MSNKRDLRAFVRFDGSGRIVAGSLILRKNKPKVGKWHEIQAYECCNYIPSPSTTTTTTQGGGVTPTAFIRQYWTSEPEACANPPFGNLLFYSASSVLQAGITIFQDAGLTIPVLPGRVIDVNPKLAVGVGGLLSVYECPTTTTTTTQALTFYNGDYSFNPAGDICNGTGQFNLPVLFPNGICGSGTVTLAPGYTFNQFGIFPGSTVRLKDPSTNNIVQINVSSGLSAFSFGCTATCSEPTTTTTTTTQAGIFAVLSNSSCGSGTAIQVQFTTGESLCDAPLAISGDFSSAPEQFYIVYNGISKLFVKTSPTTAQGASGECVVC